LWGYYKRSNQSQPASVGDVVLDPVQHRFRRIREQSGTVYYETSPDGQSWTTRWSVSNVFTDPGNLVGAIGVGALDGANGDPTPAYVENVNTTVPAIPRGLTATAVSESRIELSWQDRSVNETGFVSERRPATGGAFAEIATVAANVTTYADEGLPAATAFEYRVRAVGDGGSSAPTKVVSAATLEPPPPPPPVDLALTAIDAPEAATRGGVVEIRVTLLNLGGVEVEDLVTITLRDGADQVIGTSEVEGLAAGASVERVFAWDTKDAPLGENTLTASHDFSDDEADN